jgi:hypothetical protein
VTTVFWIILTLLAVGLGLRLVLVYMALRDLTR